MNKKNRGEKIVLKVCLRRYSTLYKILKLKIDQNGLLNGGFCCKMFYFRCSSFWKWFESLSEEKCHGKICEPRVVLLRFLRDRTNVFDWPHKIRLYHYICEWEQIVKSHMLRDQKPKKIKHRSQKVMCQWQS